MPRAYENAYDHIFLKKTCLEQCVEAATLGGLVGCQELNLQTSDPSTLFLWIYREGPISLPQKTLPIFR